MSILYIGKAREYGAEQPYCGGILKFRLPFIHYGIDVQSMAQGAILACTHFGALVVMQQVLGIPENVALFMVAVNGSYYLWHTSFGDPGIAGWITAGIPLYITYLSAYAPGVDRLLALIAFQTLVAAMFVVLGVTGLAKWVIQHFPISLRSGILLAAGMASLERIFNPKQPFFAAYPISFTIALLASFFILFSNKALIYRKKHNWFKWMAGWGIVPGYIVGYVIGIIAGEVTFPTMAQLSEKFFISAPIGEMIRTITPFGIGWPGAEAWIAGFSMAIVAYVLAFGDMLVLQALTKEVNDNQPDEFVLYDPTRNHLITAWRNILEIFTMPYIVLSGPIWAGATAVVANRAMHSDREELDSYWSAANSFNLGALVLFCSPIVLILLPAKIIGFGITLALQGYLCVYIAYDMCTNNVQRGIAGTMAGCIIAGNFTHISPILSGPTLGLVLGVVLWAMLAPADDSPHILESRKKASESE